MKFPTDEPMPTRSVATDDGSLLEKGNQLDARLHATRVVLPVQITIEVVISRYLLLVDSLQMLSKIVCTRPYLLLVLAVSKSTDVAIPGSYITWMPASDVTIKIILGTETVRTFTSRISAAERLSMPLLVLTRKSQHRPEMNDRRDSLDFRFCLYSLIAVRAYEVIAVLIHDGCFVLRVG